MINVHVNCDPFENIPPVRFARLWSDVGTTLSTTGGHRHTNRAAPPPPFLCASGVAGVLTGACVRRSRTAPLGLGATIGYTVQPFADAASEQRVEFAGVKQFVDVHLRRTEIACRAHNESAYTVLTLEVVTMTWYLVRFGFYDFQELLRLSDVLLAILDSRHISRSEALGKWGGREG